ncbi:sugar phosphate isomerase/epimerase family protein [Propionivibrio dicarboxylicus]|uniref:Sugar phosphate isomerase/epimerase n=1 Tax=Propionivibrio dicarboxylicus TaxID=83767 RepID=A0A1G7XSF1_9RHOO|nr:sugar phosphate isomerase/epimerase family protein [Propionivibrio dicarboxylicus]SDG86953.1 Sugar phosphate isomerase/epimerase [Propionivibrio dicarboxylicus]
MRLAVCNELFGHMPLRDAAAMTARCGFHGLELAPFTVFGDFTAPAIKRGIAETKAALQASGLRFAGFHWLLAKPDGLHITTADKALRQKSWDHLRRLLDAAAELGGGNMILGSPKQRGTPPGQTHAETIDILTDELAAIAPYAAERQSAILLEALSSDQTDVVNLMSEVDTIIRRINNPGVCGMFDFHNCADESSSYEALIDRHFDMIRHVHLNDSKGNAPACGDTSYHPAFATLKRFNYAAWVSLEIFSIPEDPLKILQQTMAYLNEVETMTK